MKRLILAVALVGVGTVIGTLSSNSLSASAIAQFAPPAPSGEAL